jgi:O-antigen ligase
MRPLLKLKDNRLHYILFTLFFLFSCLQFVYKSGVFSVLAFLALIPSLFCPLLCLPVMSVSMYLGIFYMPFGIPLSLFIYTVFFVGAGIRLASKKNKPDYPLVAACVLAAIFAIAASLLSASKDMYYARDLVTSIAILIMFSLYRTEQITHLTRLLFFAASLFAIFNFALYLSDNLVAVQSRLTVTPSINVNSYGIALAQTGVTLVFATLRLKKYYLKAATALLFIMTAYLLFLTGSRTSALSLFITAALVMFFAPDLKAAVKAAIFSAGLISAAALFFFTDIFTVFLGRQGGFSGRTDIWRALIFHIIPSNFWFGIGFTPADMGVMLARYGARTSYAHNIALAALAGGGIFFALALFAVIIMCFRKAYLAARACPLAGLPLFLLCSLLLTGIAEDIYISKFFWCVMGWGLAYYNSVTLKEEVCPAL